MAMYSVIVSWVDPNGYGTKDIYIVKAENSRDARERGIEMFQITFKAQWGIEFNEDGASSIGTIFVSEVKEGLFNQMSMPNPVKSGFRYICKNGMTLSK